MKMISKIFLVLIGWVILVKATQVTEQYDIITKLNDRFPYIKINCNPLSLICELNYKDHSIRLQLDANFYVFDKKIINFQNPILWEDGVFYISKILVYNLEEQLVIKTINLKEETTSVSSPNNEHNGKKDTTPLVEDTTNDSNSNKNILLDSAISTNSNHLAFIILDAGHGGKDPGAKGYQGVTEKSITLTTTNFLKEQLALAFPSTKIILTRADDTFIELEKRSKIGNDLISSGNTLGIFISLHCNAIFSPSTQGFEIYYLADKPTNEEARRVMIRENQTTDSSLYVRATESYLISERIQHESKTLATQFQKAFIKHLHLNISNRGVRRADFSVLRGVAMPGLLIELGYITNPKEALLLQSSHFHEKLGMAVISGIQLFLQQKDRNYIINND